MAQDKTRKELKALAKRGDSKNARVLAKEIVRSNKVRDRLSVSKARLGSIGMQLQNQLGMLPVISPSLSRAMIIKRSFWIALEYT